MVMQLRKEKVDNANFEETKFSFFGVLSQSKPIIQREREGLQDDVILRNTDVIAALPHS